MAVTWKDDVGHTLSNAVQTIVTFSASAIAGGAKVLGATMTNTGGTVRTISIYLIPTGQAAADIYLIFKGPIGINDTSVAPGGPWPASASAFVQAKQDAGTDVILRVHAFEEI